MWRVLILRCCLAFHSCVTCSTHNTSLQSVEKIVVRNQGGVRMCQQGVKQDTVSCGSILAPCIGCYRLDSEERGEERDGMAWASVTTSFLWRWVLKHLEEVVEDLRVVVGSSTVMAALQNAFLRLLLVSAWYSSIGHPVRGTKCWIAPTYPTMCHEVGSLWTTHQ